MEKRKIRTISKEEVEKVINYLNKAEEKDETKHIKFDYSKVKETINNFKGCTPQTIAGVCIFAFLLLPKALAMTVIEMSKRMIVVSEITDMLKEKYPDFECKVSKTSEK